MTDVFNSRLVPLPVREWLRLRAKPLKPGVLFWFVLSPILHFLCAYLIWNPSSRSLGMFGFYLSFALGLFLALLLPIAVRGMFYSFYQRLKKGERTGPFLSWLDVLTQPTTFSRFLTWCSRLDTVALVIALIATQHVGWAVFYTLLNAWHFYLTWVLHQCNIQMACQLTEADLNELDLKLSEKNATPTSATKESDLRPAFKLERVSDAEAQKIRQVLKG